MHRLVSPTAGNSAIHEGRQLGRDVLSRIIYGARVSVIIGLSATSVNLVVALLIGTTTGFFGGKLDMVVQRFVDAWMSFPGLLILITVTSLVGQGQLQIMEQEANAACRMRFPVGDARLSSVGSHETAG